jgi:hypothetical protein
LMTHDLPTPASPRDTSLTRRILCRPSLLPWAALAALICWPLAGRAAAAVLLCWPWGDQRARSAHRWRGAPELLLG